MQTRFVPTHESMAALNLTRAQSAADLSFELRKAFSGIVAGSIKAQGLAQIEAQGPFQLRGDPEIMTPLAELLQDFVDQKRLTLPIDNAKPCYEVVD